MSTRRAPSARLELRRSAAAAAAAAAATEESDDDGSLSEDAHIATSSSVQGEQSNADDAASGILAHHPTDLLRAVSADRSLRRLQPALLATLRNAAHSLQQAIHIETVAHALTLYRYVRLQQQLMAARGYPRKAAARKLNSWIAAAYSQRCPDLLARIKRNAHRLFDVFREPANEEEWWPELLEKVAAAGGRAKHLLTALFALDSHHSAIVESYDKADWLQLMRYYLLTKRWSGCEIESDLKRDGIVGAPASPTSVSSLPALSGQAQQLRVKLEGEEAKDEEAKDEHDEEAVSLFDVNKELSLDPAALGRRGAASASPLLQAVDGAVAMELDDEQLQQSSAHDTHASEHALNSQQQQQQQQQQDNSPLATSQRSRSQRRRTSADSPLSSQHQQIWSPEQRTLEQQLADAQAALLQQQIEAEERAAAAASSTCRVEKLVYRMEQTHVDHVRRVSDPQGLGATSDPTADALTEIAELQAGLLAPPGQAHFYAVSQSMVEQWTADLGVLEAALGGPHALSPYGVRDDQAQTVVDHLRAMWTELENSPSCGPPYMQLLLLSKRLRCIDQLRPAAEELEGQPPILWQVLELRALLLQVAAHDKMWAFTVRWPFSYLEGDWAELCSRAAEMFVRASLAAAPDVGQQARLLVEQCKALERIGQLHRAQYLGANVLVLQYPEAPLQVLHDLHTQYAPAAGPPLDFALLQLFEERSGWSEDDWERESAAAETHAAELEEQLQLDEAAGVLRKKALKKQRRHAERAHKQADMLAARPHSFTAAMKKSLKFFHPDKRQRTGSAAEGTVANAEFARLQEAWKVLDACCTYFEQLRAYQEQIPAAMEQ